MKSRARASVLMLIAACGPSACGGGEHEPSATAPAPPPQQRARSEPRGLDDSNDVEVTRLVKQRAGAGGRVTCRTVARLPGAAGSRFACTALGRRYDVTWEHYGSGRYVISAGGRVLANGVLTISE